MTLPAGITTCTVTLGKALGSLFDDATLSGTVQVDRRLVWTATGDTIYPVASSVVASQSGGWLSFVAAHVDQSGFVDQSGNSITNFSYTFNGRATFSDGSVVPIVKNFQVFVGQSTLDLDLLPDGPATLPVVTPIPPVDNAAVAGFVSNPGPTNDALLDSIVAAITNPTSDVRAALDALYGTPPGPAVPTLAESGPGWQIRANSLDVYRTSKADPTIPTEVVIFGDSTSYGQNDQGNYTGGWVRALRDILAAHGCTDGGPGILHFADTAAGSSDNIAPVFASTGAAAPTSLIGYDYLLDDMCELATTGNEVTYQGHGTIMRIPYTKQGGYARATYSIDGGAPVTFDAAKTESGVDSYVGYLQVDGLSNTLHKVRIVNIGTAGGGTGPIRVAVEFLRAGIVLHKHAVGGKNYSNFFPDNGVGHPIGRAALGLNQASSNATPYALAARPPYRKTALAISALGINDGDPAVTATGAQVFADEVAAAGCDGILVVPHFKYAYAVGTGVRAAQQAAIENVAATNGLSIIHFDQALDDINYTGPGTHLDPTGYQAIAELVATVLLK